MECCLFHRRRTIYISDDFIQSSCLYHNVEYLATDIDENALARAKLGIYPERSLNEVPNEMKKKYFLKKEAYYKISDEIKRTVKFKKHNLLAGLF